LSAKVNPLTHSIKIRAVSNYSDSFSIHDRIIDQFMTAKHFKDNVEFVVDDSYEWLVVFNSKGDFDIKVPKERVIGFIQEPPDHNFFDRNIGSYCSVVYTCAEPYAYGIEGNLVGFPMGMFYHLHGELEEFMTAPKKTARISMITSNISGGFYEYRIRLARELAQTGWCSVYGRGLNFKGVKGELSNKATGLLPFQFSVCIESGIWDDYISEKAIDAALCSCIPIYVGAKNIANYIPFAIPLENFRNSKYAVKEIEHILQSTNYDDFIQPIKAWKKKYITKCNIYEKIKQTIKP
jgi:hypothetical protein